MIFFKRLLLLAASSIVFASSGNANNFDAKGLANLSLSVSYKDNDFLTRWVECHNNFAGCTLIIVANTTGSVTVTNYSTSVTAKNIALSFPAAYSGVTVTTPCTTALAPQASCTITMQAPNSFIPGQGTVTVQGSNTTATSFIIVISP